LTLSVLSLENDGFLLKAPVGIGMVLSRLLAALPFVVFPELLILIIMLLLIVV
jgi:hypothetical protein